MNVPADHDDKDIAPLVVLVDDDEIVSRAAGRVLATQGYRTQSVHPEKIDDVFARIVPDVVIADVNMAGLTGPMIVRMLAASPSTRQVRTILYSGLGTDALEEIALACGASAVVSKADGPTALINAVGKLCGRPSNGAGHA